MHTTLRWSARVLSILMAATLLVFAFGEGLHRSRFTARELLMFSFFPLGFCVGMLLAWWREALGGAITVASLAVFCLVDRFSSGSFPRGYAFGVLAVPGFLFLLSGLWTRSVKKHQVR